VTFSCKRLRLATENYRGRRVYFVTLCCEKRRPWFAAEAKGRWILESLLKTAANYNFLIHAYCVMPDHVHVLAEGKLDSCNLISFANMFKQRTAHQFKQRGQERLWQRRYYDHILRRDESIEAVACYIWMNPVRRGLCADASAYSLSGSQTIDWMVRSRTGTAWVPPWRSL
jgi:putative transposase